MKRSHWIGALGAGFGGGVRDGRPYCRGLERLASGPDSGVFAGRARGGGGGLKTPVIDFHIHVAKPEDYRPWVIEWTMGNIGREQAEAYISHYLSPSGIKELLDESGVDYAVALAEMSPISTGITTNEYVSDFCRGNPRLLPFASINPYMIARPADELRRVARGLGDPGEQHHRRRNWGGHCAPAGAEVGS